MNQSWENVLHSLHLCSHCASGKEKKRKKNPVEFNYSLDPQKTCEELEIQKG